MISVQKKFLFIHVPKTGGNSIQNILKGYSEDEVVIITNYQDGVERFQLRNKKYKISKHSPLFHYKYILDEKTYRSLYKFAVIRNPWDMMVSSYFSPSRGRAEWDRTVFLELLRSVKTWRYYICERSFLEKGLRRLNINFDINLNRKKLGKDLDFLIRFEQLNDDFKLVCEKLNIPYSSLPHRNRSNHEHYSHYYDDELKELVRKKFREEIKYGNYEFEAA